MIEDESNMFFPWFSVVMAGSGTGRGAERRWSATQRTRANELAMDKSSQVMARPHFWYWIVNETPAAQLLDVELIERKT